MSKSASSPSARLLQTSRLFSLPRALPAARIARERAIGSIFSSSDTATAPYPTHQALETPFQSQLNGDWGLKRSLPLRTTNKGGAPKIRVLAQDTDDHVTNFESANDHERTLAKFTEMAAPVVRKTSQSVGFGALAAIGTSVFENNVDITNPAAKVQGWKSESPWLGGLTNQELDRYLRQVQLRIGEWKTFVANWHATEEFEAYKSKQKQEQGYIGPIEYLDLEARRQALLDKPNLEDTAQEVKKLDDRLSSFKLAQRLHKSELKAQQAIEYAEQKGAAILATDPQNQELADKIESEKLNVRRDADNLIDEAGDAIVDAFNGPSAFEDITLQKILQSGLNRSERRAQLSSYSQSVLDRERQDDELRNAKRKQWAKERLESFRPDDTTLENVLHQLRSTHRQEQQSSTLTSLVVRFLRLPGIIERHTTTNATDSKAFREQVVARLYATGAEELPPSTHPSAGIGYLRSGTNMDNHPIFGPQARRAPVLARVIRPRNSKFGNAQQAMLGVAGFVANDPKFGTGSESRKSLLALSDPDRMATAYDPDQQGGNKMWVHPTHAIVDESGKVRLSLLRADPEAVAVKTGSIDEIMARKQESRSGRPFSPSRDSTSAGFQTSVGSTSSSRSFRPPQNQRATLIN